jgi:hypothetical protein
VRGMPQLNFMGDEWFPSVWHLLHVAFGLQDSNLSLRSRDRKSSARLRAGEISTWLDRWDAGFERWQMVALSPSR